MKKIPKVSIVIPAYNEEKTIGKLLDSLMKLDYPKKKLEIIGVINCYRLKLDDNNLSISSNFKTWITN